MAWQKCTSCGGVFNDTLPDGGSYFHVCPPLSAVEVAAAVLAGKLVLPALETADLAVSRRVYERQTKRDENPVPNVNPKLPATMKSLGQGVTPSAPPVGNGAPVVVNV